MEDNFWPYLYSPFETNTIPQLQLSNFSGINALKFEKEQTFFSDTNHDHKYGEARQMILAIIFGEKMSCAK